MSEAKNAPAGNMCACMCVVSDMGCMHASFSVYRIREMLHRRCVLVRVPWCVPLSVAVGRWAQHMYAGGKRQTSRSPGCMC